MLWCTGACPSAAALYMVLCYVVQVLEYSITLWYCIMVQVLIGSAAALDMVLC